MDDITQELHELFASSAPNGLAQDVLTELQSMLRLHGITPQELFYKWESYSMKMGSEDTKLDLNTVRAFKRDVQDSLERETRGKNHQVRGSEKKSGVTATPRAGKTDVFGMYDLFDLRLRFALLTNFRLIQARRFDTRDSSITYQWLGQTKIDLRDTIWTQDSPD